MADVSHPWAPEALLDRALGFERYGEPPLEQAVYSNGRALREPQPTARRRS